MIIYFGLEIRSRTESSARRLLQRTRWLGTDDKKPRISRLYLYIK